MLYQWIYIHIWEPWSSFLPWVAGDMWVVLAIPISAMASARAGPTRCRDRGKQSLLVHGHVNACEVTLCALSAVPLPGTTSAVNHDRHSPFIALALILVPPRRARRLHPRLPERLLACLRLLGRSGWPEWCLNVCAFKKKVVLSNVYDSRCKTVCECEAHPYF